MAKQKTRELIGIYDRDGGDLVAVVFADDAGTDEFCREARQLGHLVSPVSLETVVFEFNERMINVLEERNRHCIYETSGNA